MTALATLDDVAAVSRAVPESDADQVERLLEMVSARVRTYTGQTFDLVNDDEITVYPDDGVITLPQRPVVSISSVTEYASGVIAPSGYQPDSSGRLHRVALGQRRPWRCAAPLTVVYTHGYAEIPDDIRMVVAEVAAARWNASSTNPTMIAGSSSQDVAGYSESTSFRLPADSPSAWSAEHLETLDAYRRPKLGSVKLS